MLLDRLDGSSPDRVPSERVPLLPSLGAPSTKYAPEKRNMPAK